MTYQPHRIAPARSGLFARLFWLGADANCETPHEPVTARQHPSDFDRFSARHGALIDGVCDFLARAQLDPAPHHYELAWHYLSSASASERFRIETHLLEEGHIAPDVAEQLLADMRPAISTQALETMIEAARAGILDARASTDRTGREAAEYGVALAGGMAAMNGAAASGPALVRLQRLTQDMVARITRAEAELKQQSQAMGKLRSRLAQSQKEALSDPLTGLPNRRAFERRLHDAISNARAAGSAAAPRTLSVAFCDIDHFKAINDAHGHATGDRIIALVADLLKSMGGAKCHVARHGGEEFALLFDGMDVDAAEAQVERARQKLHDKRLIAQDSGADIGTVSFSGGLAELRGDDTSASLLARADRALYAAKNEGRDCIRIG